MENYNTIECETEIIAYALNEMASSLTTRSERIDCPVK